MHTEHLTPSTADEPHPSQRWRSVAHLLQAMARDHGARPAVSFRAVEWDYRTLEQQSALAARRLLAAGVTPGDRLGILIREASAHYVAYALAAVRLGAIVVPANAR